ncbi:MAG: DNA-binding protein [Ruminococcaceae bacterium]|nr:DNA-binding protein [Oscillospiraceae bacterium]
MFEKNLQIGYLLDFYGEVLPERRREIMDLYYNDDLSLAEIAETIGITRQAVREAVKKTETELYFYEEKLGLLRRFKEAEGHAQKALALCEGTGSVPDALRREIKALCAVVATPEGI